MSDDLRSKRLDSFRRRLDNLVQQGEITSLYDWCRRAKVAYSTVHGFLSGVTEIMSDRTLVKLAQAVNRPVEWLRGDDPADSIPAGMEQRWRVLFQQLPPDAQQEWLDTLEARLAVQRRNGGQ